MSTNQAPRPGPVGVPGGQTAHGPLHALASASEAVTPAHGTHGAGSQGGQGGHHHPTAHYTSAPNNYRYAAHPAGTHAVQGHHYAATGGHEGNTTGLGALVTGSLMALSGDQGGTGRDITLASAAGGGMTNGGGGRAAAAPQSTTSTPVGDGTSSTGSGTSAGAPPSSRGNNNNNKGGNTKKRARATVPGASVMGKDSKDDVKKATRREQNRHSAQQFRRRKKEYVTGLEQQITTLQQQVSDIRNHTSIVIMSLTDTVRDLRERLANTEHGAPPVTRAEMEAMRFPGAKGVPPSTRPLVSGHGVVPAVKPDPAGAVPVRVPKEEAGAAQGSGSGVEAVSTQSPAAVAATTTPNIVQSTSSDPDTAPVSTTSGS